MTRGLTNSSGRDYLEVLPMSKTLPFFDFSCLFSIIKRKSRCTRWRVVYISIRRTLHVFDFSGLLDYLTARKRRLIAVQNPLHSFSLIWNNLVNYSAQVNNIPILLGIMCVLSIYIEKHWKDILR